MSFPSAPPQETAQLRDLLATPRRIAIVSHYNPDGDAMGSALGLGHVLSAAGHHAQVVMPNLPAANLRWFPGYGEVLTHERDGDRAAEARAAASCCAAWTSTAPIAWASWKMP